MYLFGKQTSNTPNEDSAKHRNEQKRRGSDVQKFEPQREIATLMHSKSCALKLTGMRLSAIKRKREEGASTNKTTWLSSDNSSVTSRLWRLTKSATSDGSCWAPWEEGTWEGMQGEAQSYANAL